MATILDLAINVKYNGGEATAQVRAATQGFTKMQASIVSMQSAFTLANGVISQFRQVVIAMVNDFANAETAMIALQSALKSTNQATGDYEKQLISLADKLQTTSVYEDDEIIRMQALLINYGRTAEEVKKLTPILVDLASKMSLNSGETVSLQSAYNAYTSAINGMEKPLRQYGINLDDTILKTKDASAITEQLKNNVIGASEEYSKTTKGSIAQFNVAIGQLREALGGLIVFFTSDDLKNSTIIFNDIATVIQYVNDKLRDSDSLLASIVKRMGLLSTLVGVNLYKDFKNLVSKSSEFDPKIPKDGDVEEWNLWSETIKLSGESIENTKNALVELNDAKSATGGGMQGDSIRNSSGPSVPKESEKDFRSFADMIESQTFFTALTESLTSFTSAMMYAQTITSGLMAGLNDLFNGKGFNGGKILLDIFKNIIIALIQMVLQALIFKAIMSLLGLGSASKAIPVPTVGKIPQFAAGGRVDAPTLGILGENGPELIVPEKSFNDIMNGKYSKGVSTSGNTYNITVQASPTFSTVEEQAKEIVKKFKEMTDTQDRLVLA